MQQTHSSSISTICILTYFPTDSLRGYIPKFRLVYLIFGCNKIATVKIIASVGHSMRCRYWIPCATHSTLYYIKWLLLYCFACVRNLALHDDDNDDDDGEWEWYWEVSPFSKYTDFGRTHSVYTEKNKYFSSVATTFFSFVCSRLPSFHTFLFASSFASNQSQPSVEESRTTIVRACVSVCVRVCHSVCSLSSSIFVSRHLDTYVYALYEL